MNTAVQGLRTTQGSLDVIANNLANVDTVGFKGGRADFAESLNATIKPSTPDAAGNTGAGGIQVGTGVGTSSTVVDFRQGTIVQTGLFTDLALEGEGFFLVRTTQSNELFATRSGNFRLDTQGFLVTDRGLRVQGIPDPVGNPNTVGDIRFTGGIAYEVDDFGQVNAIDENGTKSVRGQILLQRFTSPQALLKAGDNLYSNLEAAGANPAGAAGGFAGGGEILAGALRPTEAGVARIQSGALENSNVDLAREFSEMIITQRAFQANSRVISTSDEMMLELVNLKR